VQSFLAKEKKKRVKKEKKKKNFITQTRRNEFQIIIYKTGKTPNKDKNVLCTINP
jgi:hypothetical protein